jgi:hypothetical protein
MRKFLTLCLSIFVYLQSSAALAQTFPNQKTEVWTAKDFRFHTGEVMQALNIGTRGHSSWHHWHGRRNAQHRFRR